MADFPAIEPSGRSYSLGVFTLSRMQSVGGGSVRFNHGTTAYGHVLSLRFDDLADADAELIREHYDGQEGGYLSFALPDIVWRGHGDVEDLVPSSFRWRYVAPPQEDSKPGGFQNVTVTLECVGPEVA